MKMKLLSISIIVSSLVIGCTNETPMSSTQTTTPSKATVETAVSQDITLGAGEDAYVDNESVIDESKSGSTKEDNVASSALNTNIAFKDASSTGSEGSYIKHIQLAVSASNKNVSCQPGYTKLDIDLNEGAGGDWVYLCYTKTNDIDRVSFTGINQARIYTYAHNGHSVSELEELGRTGLKAGYSRVAFYRDGVKGTNNYDLNPGAKYFIHITTDNSSETPFKDLAVISTGSSYHKSTTVQDYKNDGWLIVDRDLNSWAGGEYIFIAARR